MFIIKFGSQFLSFFFISLYRKSFCARGRHEVLKNVQVLPEVHEQNGDECVDKYDMAIASSTKFAVPQEEGLEEKAKLILQSGIPSEKEISGFPVALSCSPKSITSLSPPASPTQPTSLLQNGTKQCGRNSVTIERQLSLYASQQSLAIHSLPYFPPDIKDPDNEMDETKESSEKMKKNWKYYLNKLFDTSLFKVRKKMGN